MTRQSIRNLRVVGGLACVLAVMVTLVVFSVPLYRLFCEVTGLGGTPQRVAADTATVSPHMVTVRFNADVAPGLPWHFAPAQGEMRLHLGESALAFFTAKNLGNQAMVGHATFNVTPTKTGIYFNKIQCFCFSDERLEAGESVRMPVEFFVDPALAEDINTRDVAAITLSYTFFPSANPANPEDLARFAPDAPPDSGRGKDLFAQRCAACHSLDTNGIGPALGAVFGRAAGAAAGYAYSPALKNARLAWDAATLDRWLADPQAVAAGNKMPIKVLEPGTRRDIVAYLASLPRLDEDRASPKLTQ